MGKRVQKDILVLFAALCAAVAGVLLIEWRWDLGNAWIGIVGVLGGSLVTFGTDLAKSERETERRREELALTTGEARAEWVRERRFAAYEEMILVLRQAQLSTRTSARLGVATAEDCARSEEATDAVIRAYAKAVAYGSEPMRRLLADGGPVLPALTVGDVDADMFDEFSADFGLHRQKVVELVATEIDELLSAAPADGGGDASEGPGEANRRR